MANDISIEILTEINKSLKSLETLSAEANKSFKAVTDSANKAAKERETATKKSNDQIAKSFDTIKVAAQAAFAFFAGRAVINAFNDVIKAASEEQQAIQRLNTSLQLTGKFTEEASVGFVDFADSIEKTTAQTGEAVLSAGALIQSMTRLDTEALKVVTEGAVNLSAVFGKDLSATSRLLGKAINGNTGVLKQFGIEIEAGGTKAQRLEKIIAALAKSQGAAAAQSNTFAGASTQLSNAFDDISKSLGRVIVDNPAVTASIKVVTEFVRVFSQAIDSNADAIKGLIDDGLSSLIRLLPELITPVQFAATSVTVLNEVFFRFIQTAAQLGKVFVSGPILAFNGLGVVLRALQNDLVFAALKVSEFFDLLGLSDGSRTDGLKKSLDEIRNSIAETALTIEETDTGKFFNGIIDGSEGAIKVTDSLAGTFVGTFEKARAGIGNAANSFDKLKKNASSAGKSIKSVGDISDEETESVTVNNKDTLESYNKINASVDSLAKEIDNKTLTAIEGADQELKRQNELLALARREIDVNVKLTKQEKDRANEQLNNFDKLIKRKNELAKEDAPSQAFEEARKPGKEAAEEIKRAISGGGSEAASAIFGAATGFMDVIGAINGSIGFLQGIVDAIPSILNNVSKLFNSIADLPGEILKSVRGLARAAVRLVSEFIPSLLRELPVIVKELAIALIETIPNAIIALIDALPDLVIAFVDALTDSDLIERLVVGLINAQPRIMLALVDAFIVKGGAFRIGIAIAKAMTIELPKALANGIAQGLKDLSGSIGGAIASGFKTAVENVKITPPKFPELKFPEFKVPENIRDLFNGKAFVSRVTEAFNNFIEEFKKALTPGKGGVVGKVTESLGKAGGAIGKAGSNLGRAAGLATGGTVYAREGLFVAKGTDTVPAMLTPGETVVSRKDTDRLSLFLDEVTGTKSSSPSGPDPLLSEMVRLLKGLSRSDSSEKNLTVNIQVGEKQLSEVLLNLNRQGFRTA